MKKTLIASLVVSSISFVCTDTGAATLTTKEQKLGYSIGNMFGSRIMQDFKNLDMKIFFAGLKDGYSGKKGLMTKQEIEKTIQAFQKEQMEKARKEKNRVAAENKAKSQVWLKKIASEKGVKKTKDGLLYKVIKEGRGAHPKMTDTVKVDYEGTLVNGKVFDSSYKRVEPVTFQLNQVIPGWSEGLQLMKVGSKYTLYIPADLAYGPGGTGPILPNSALKFVVKLRAIVKPDAKKSETKMDRKNTK